MTTSARQPWQPFDPQNPATAIARAELQLKLASQQSGSVREYRVREAIALRNWASWRTA